MKYSFILAAIVVAFGLGSCSNDETPVTPTPSTLTPLVKSNLSPSEADGWLYYSFDKDTVIDASKASGSDWDIKFRYTKYDTTSKGIGNFISIYTGSGPIFFNSGTVNNNGQTQATIVDMPFDSVTDATKYTYRNDDTSKTTRIIPVALNGPTAVFNYSGPPSHAVSAAPNKTFVIKTKSNKYVKLQLLSIYKDAPASPNFTTQTNFYTFRYIKGDGTRLR